MSRTYSFAIRPLAPSQVRRDQGPGLVVAGPRGERGTATAHESGQATSNSVTMPSVKWGGPSSPPPTGRKQMAT